MIKSRYDIRTLNHNSRAFDNDNYYFFSFQAGAIIITDSADHESPVKDVAESAEQTRYLSTINYDTLSNLREENQPSDVPSAAKRQGSASQDVGEELISTCVTPTRIKTIQETLSKPETERHLCALKLLPHFFSKEELAKSNTDGSHGKKISRRYQIKLAEIISL